MTKTQKGQWNGTNPAFVTSLSWHLNHVREKEKTKKRMEAILRLKNLEGSSKNREREKIHSGSSYSQIPFSEIR
ncbi:hypothetical protein RRG08_053853 [Elysia crispata]|uniref:Uncharacterized protein n=1 Tax=Elysia crispata TaxID=231223 RepID=A0AAE1DTN7_9GAST|nr:hypothetical protein RRG08_053853 [Elysia crispata]